MSLMRSVLLAVSENRWMRERGPRLWFVRRAARRFMPGEAFDDMIRAADELRPLGIDAVFTRLGENVTDAAEASAVTRHYVDVLDRLASTGGRCEPSIKLTQLGLDLGTEQAYANLRALAERSHATGNYLWIDMEQTSYVDVTLELARRLKAEFPGIGVCLQAYLYRTAKDLGPLINQGIGVRLVKGAYKEPPELAYPKKADVDENFFALAVAMLEGLGRQNGFRPVFGTHDGTLIARIRAHAERAGLAARDVEVHMLYGIQRGEQGRLVKDGRRRPRPHRLRGLLVPLVHAPPRRAAGQRLVRRSEHVRGVTRRGRLTGGARMSRLFIGVDTGTQSTRAVLVDGATGRVLGARSAVCEILPSDVPGTKEQDPADWVRAASEVIAGVLGDAGPDAAGRVAAIGVSGQQHGFVPLDAEAGSFARRSSGATRPPRRNATTIIAKLGGLKRIIERAGNAIPPGFTASKILWLKQHEPTNYARLATVLLPHDYLNFWLTGRAHMEYGDASRHGADGRAKAHVERGGCSRRSTRTWPRSCRRCIPATEPAGKVQPATARQFGLRRDVIVSAGGGDNMMGAIGTGNVAARHRQGQLRHHRHDLRLQRSPSWIPTARSPRSATATGRLAAAALHDERHGRHRNGAEAVRPRPCSLRGRGRVATGRRRLAAGPLLRG